MLIGTLCGISKKEMPSGRKGLTKLLHVSQLSINYSTLGDMQYTVLPNVLSGQINP